MSRPGNPYVAGMPLLDEHSFFGRQDMLERVERELYNPATNALVIFGQRRIGKTSLLRQLQRSLPASDFLPIYFDLQDQAPRPLGDVLADLADTVSGRLGKNPLEESDFDDRGRLFQQVFLPRLYQSLDEKRRPIFLLDEFDVLDQVAETELQDTVSARALFPFLRHVMTEDPRPAFIFAVGRGADDLSLNVATTFKASLRFEIWVLDEESTIALVRQAEVNGTLSFSDEALVRILSLTNGHPFLTQLLCQRIWERTHKGNVTTLATVDDLEVEAAIRDTLSAGEQAFDWLWRGLAPAEKIYTAALAETAREGEPLSENRIVEVLAEHAARLREREIELAPRDLVKRKILEDVGDHHYVLTIELFRRWVQSSKPLHKVKDELDRVDPLADRQFRIGQTLFRQNKWTEAVRYFEDALQTNPRHYQARLSLGEAHLKMDNADAAVSELSIAYKQDRDEARLPLARALLAQAKAYSELNQEDAALEICDQVLQISPNEIQAEEIRTNIWIKRRDLAYEQSDLDSAVEAHQEASVDHQSTVDFLRRVLNREPQHLRARVLVGQSLLELDRPDEAVTELEHAYELDQVQVRPYLFHALIAQAESLEATGRGPEALTVYERAVVVSPNEPRSRELQAMIWIQRGNDAMKRGALDVALANYQRVSATEFGDAITAVQRALEEKPVLTRQRLHLGPTEQQHAKTAATNRSLVADWMIQAHTAYQANDLLKALAACVQVMRIDPSHPGLLDLIEEITQSIRQSTDDYWPQYQSSGGQNPHILSQNQLNAALLEAETQVRLLGIVTLDADWRTLAATWLRRSRDNPGFRVTILCESDNALFSKSFTSDTDVAENRKSFRALKMIRDSVLADLPDFLLEEALPSESLEDWVQIQVMHLPIPLSVAQIDGHTFVNLWLHRLEHYFEEVTPGHPWYRLVQEYVDTYFHPAIGRKYACDPTDELLELFDHDRIPRGIYPRSSFYDTDYSQWVVWALVFDRRGRLLIHRRSDNAKDNQGMWDKSVGGHVEFTDGDTSRAARREVVEELFSEEPEETRPDFRVVSDKEMIYLGDWRPDRRKRHPFREISTFGTAWAFFKLHDNQHLYSPRTLPSPAKGTRRLRVIAEVYLVVASPILTDEFLGRLKNSTFKLVELADLKTAMDKALADEELPGFGENRSVPVFTPDLVNIMTGELRDTLEDFAQYVKRYIKGK